MKSRYLYLDGWRGLSIIAVLIGHFLPVSGINLGRLGVEMFFVLSGRLMAEILFVNQVNLPLFFRRRISRVWPALFVFLLITGIIFSTLSGPLHITLIAAISALTFTYNYVSMYVGHSPILDHIWSLCVEEHLYLLLALIAYLTRHYKFDPIKILAALSLLFILNGFYQTVFLNLDYYKVYWRSDVRGASILLSVMFYLAIKDSPVSKYVPILFMLLGGLLSLNVIPDFVKYSLGSMCLAVSMATMHKMPSSVIKILSNPYITKVGLISFSLYLWQQLFYKLLNSFTFPYKINVMGLLFLSFCIAYLSYQFVEVIARRYLNQNWGNDQKLK